MAFVELGGIELLATPDEVVGDHDAGDRPEKRAVADEPGEDVSAGILIEFPRHHEDTEKRGDESAGAKADPLRGEVGKIVGRRDDIGRDVGREGGHGERDESEGRNPRAAELGDDLDGIPNGGAENDDSRARHQDADEGVEGHGGGKSERLADNLIALRARIAGKVGDIERERRPVADHGGEPRAEDRPEFCRGIQRGWLGEDRAESVGRVPRPPHKHQTDEEKKGRAERFHPFDRLHTADDEVDVDRPKNHEAEEFAGRDAEEREVLFGRWIEAEHNGGRGIDGRAADPRLNAEPSAGHQSAHERRDVRAEGPERGAEQHRERNAVGRARMRVEGHRDEHDEIAEENGEGGLPPIHALLDEAAGEGVSRDADRHADPEGGDVPCGPRPSILRNGSEVLVPEARIVVGLVWVHGVRS